MSKCKDASVRLLAKMGPYPHISDVRIGRKISVPKGKWELTDEHIAAIAMLPADSLEAFANGKAVPSMSSNIFGLIDAKGINGVLKALDGEYLRRHFTEDKILAIKKALKNLPSFLPVDIGDKHEAERRKIRKKRGSSPKGYHNQPWEPEYEGGTRHIGALTYWKQQAREASIRAKNAAGIEELIKAKQDEIEATEYAKVLKHYLESAKDAANSFGLKLIERSDATDIEKGELKNYERCTTQCAQTGI